MINLVSDGSYYEVVISGMGPAALALAWEAITLGKKTLLISNGGQDFTNAQPAFLNEEARRYLLNMRAQEQADEHKWDDENEEACDLKYTEEIKTLAGIAVKDIERYLWYRIQAHKNSLDVIQDCEIKTVDTLNTSIEIASSLDDHDAEKNISLFYKYLLCADDEKHHAIEIANTALPQNLQLAYNTRSSPVASASLKDKLRITFFDRTRKKTDRVLAQHGKGYILPIGDAYNQTGDGLNRAFHHAAEVGKLLMKNNLSENDIEKFQHSISKFMAKKSRGINFAALVPVVDKPLGEVNPSSPLEEKSSTSYPSHSTPHKIDLFSNAYDDISRSSGTFYELKKQIESAEHFICISAWNISLTQDLSMGKTLGELLMDAARRGVKVFILSWDCKIRDAQKIANLDNIQYLKTTNHANIYYKKYLKGGSFLDKTLLSHHQKFILTEKSATVCGMNLVSKSVDSIEHLDIGGILWHDAAICIEGDILKDLLAEFQGLWLSQPAQHILYNADEEARTALATLKPTENPLPAFNDEEDGSVQLLSTINVNRSRVPSNQSSFFQTPPLQQSTNNIHESICALINALIQFYFYHKSIFHRISSRKQKQPKCC